MASVIEENKKVAILTRLVVVISVATEVAVSHEEEDMVAIFLVAEVAVFLVVAVTVFPVDATMAEDSLPIETAAMMVFHLVVVGDVMDFHRAVVVVSHPVVTRTMFFQADVADLVVKLKRIARVGSVVVVAGAAVDFLADEVVVAAFQDVVVVLVAPEVVLVIPIVIMTAAAATAASQMSVVVILATTEVVLMLIPVTVAAALVLTVTIEVDAEVEAMRVVLAVIAMMMALVVIVEALVETVEALVVVNSGAEVSVAMEVIFSNFSFFEGRYVL